MDKSRSTSILRSLSSKITTNSHEEKIWVIFDSILSYLVFFKWVVIKEHSCCRKKNCWGLPNRHHRQVWKMAKEKVWIIEGPSFLCSSGIPWNLAAHIIPMPFSTQSVLIIHLPLLQCDLSWRRTKCRECQISYSPKIAERLHRTLAR